MKIAGFNFNIPQSRPVRPNEQMQCGTFGGIQAKYGQPGPRDLFAKPDSTEKSFDDIKPLSTESSAPPSGLAPRAVSQKPGTSFFGFWPF